MANPWRRRTIRRPVALAAGGGLALGGLALASVALIRTALIRGRRPVLLVSEWWIEATTERVWSELADLESWPAWWPGMTAVRILRAGDASGRGRQAELTVRGLGGMRLRFSVESTDLERPHAARGCARGGLVGSGRVWLADSRGGTTVRIHWNVAPSSRIVRVLRPLAVAAHADVMAAGERGLRIRLRSAPGGPETSPQ